MISKHTLFSRIKDLGVWGLCNITVSRALALDVAGLDSIPGISNGLLSQLGVLSLSTEPEESPADHLVCPPPQMNPQNKYI